MIEKLLGQGEVGVLEDLLELPELDVLPLLASLVGLQLLAGILVSYTWKVG